MDCWKSIESMTSEQLAGQRLMVGFNGTELDPNLKFMIGDLKVGGIILFSRNIESPDQIRALCESVQAHARLCRQPPLFIAIDQEGGEVARLKPPFTQFPGNPQMKSVDDAAHFARVTARELSAVGINMNMAPVLDVAKRGLKGIMKGRVFGDDPLWVSCMGAEVITQLQERKVMAVAKHFPGIGKTTLDSHLERPELDADIMELKKDLIPFDTAIKSRVAGIMLSHIMYQQIDDVWPASLSVGIARNLLRDQMGYRGVVMTDDLDMGAIVNHYELGPAVERIFLADIDITLICHQDPKIETAFEHFLRCADSSGAAKQKAIVSVERIVKLKRQYLDTNRF